MEWLFGGGGLVIVREPLSYKLGDDEKALISVVRSETLENATKGKKGEKILSEL